MGYRLGVDLGTTFTSAAIYTSGWPQMVGLGRRAMQVPSVLFLKPDNEFLVGDTAEAHGAGEPERMAREFKRRFGDQVPILVAGSPHSAQALQAHLLAWVVDQVSQRQGSAPDHVTLTYPANWGLYKQDLFTQTIRMADVLGAETCTEPEAAATLYAARNVMAEGDCIVIYDLGGGTFDVAALRKTAAGFDLLGRPDGLEHLGGIDFDEAVFQHVLADLGDAVTELPDDPALTASLARLRRDCVDAKEALSSDTETAIPVALPGLVTSVRLVRDELEDMLRPALADTIAATRRAITSAELTPVEVTAIVLTGGSSRIPLVSQLLTSAFERPLALDTHPKHDVALGAALRGAPLLATAPGGPGPGGPAAASGWPPPPWPPPTIEAASPPGPQHAGDALEPGDDAGPSRGSWRRALLVVGLVLLLVTAAVAVVLVVSSNQGGEKQADDDNRTTPTTTGPPTTPRTPTTPPSSAPPTVPTDTLLLTNHTKKGKTSILRVDVDSDPVSFRRVHLTALPGGEQSWLPTVSPDRRSFIFLAGDSVHGPFEPWVKPLDEAAHRLLTPDSPCQTTGRPAFNPAGDALAVICPAASAPDGPLSLFVIDLEGNLVRALVTDGTPIGNPTWTEDGQVIFQRFLGTGVPQKLWSIPADGSRSEPHRVTFGTAWDSHEDYCTGTGRLLFLRSLGDDRGGMVYASKEDGGGFVRVGTVDDAQAPSWSPDCQQIAFLRKSGKRVQLWVMGADGSSPHQLALGAGKLGPPAWDSR